MGNLPGYIARQTLPIAGAVLGGVAGRYTAGMVPALQKTGFLPAAGRAVASAVGEGTGLATGIVGEQAVSGISQGQGLSQVDVPGALGAGGLQTGLSLGAAGTAYGLGRAGGVKSKPAGAAVGRPGFAARLPQSAAMDTAAEIASTAKNVPLSPGRVTLEEFIAAHDQAEKFIDNKKLLDAMERAMPRGQSREAVAARRMLRQDMRRMREEIRQLSSSNKYIDDPSAGFARSAPSGQYFPYKPPTPRPGTQGMTYPMSAYETDQVIQNSLTSAVKKELEGKVGGTAYKAARARARNLAAQEMYRSLGKGAAEAGESAHKALLARESVVKTFPTDPELDIPTPTAVSRVVKAGSLTEADAPIYLKRLRALDNAFGTKLANKVQELGFKMEWGPKDEQAANIIADTLNIPRGRTGVGNVRSGIRILARLAVRSQGMTGAAARGFASKAFEDAMRNSP